MNSIFTSSKKVQDFNFQLNFKLSDDTVISVTKRMHGCIAPAGDTLLDYHTSNVLYFYNIP